MLTVVICTYNRCESLLTTLDSLRGQRWSGDWEVLVVDNASDDDTAAALVATAETFPVPLRTVREERRGLSAARNRALREARGATSLFLDDDVTCSETWLAELGEAYRDADIQGTGAPILPLLPPETPSWWFELLESEVGGPTSRYEFGKEMLPIEPEGPVARPMGANMGVRTATALELGGFRLDLGWGTKLVPSEEYDFFGRLLGAGAPLLYVGGAPVQHRIDPARTSWEYYLRWQRGFGRSQVVMEPPGDLGDRLRRMRRQLRRHRKWRRRSSRERNGSLQWRLAEREKTRCVGALLQLLGF